MIAKVLAWMRMSRHLGEFDYKIPEELSSYVQLGSLVTVPFRRSTIIGLIDDIAETSTHTKSLRPIRSVLSIPPLSSGYRAFLHQFADQHRISPALALKIAIPKLSSRFAKAPSTRRESESHELNIVMLPHLPPLPRLRFTPQREWICGTREIRYAVLQKMLFEERPILCVMATHYDVQALYASLPESLRKVTRALDPLSSTRSIAEAMLDFLNGRARIVMGTKRVAFFPAPASTQLILDEEEHRNHHQFEQNPRYHVRDVLHQRSQWEHFPLHITGHSRSLDHVQRNIPSTVVFPKNTNRVNWIALPDHPGRPLTVPMADDLQESVTRGQVFLFFNRSQETARFECRECARSIRCEICSRTLTQSLTTLTPNDAWCGLCNTVKPIPTLCPECHSRNIVLATTTLRRLEKAVQSAIGNRSIQRCSKKDPTFPLRSSVVIGTEFAIPYLALSHLSMVGIVDVDQLLAGKSFAAEFDGFLFLRSFLARLRAYRTIHTVIQHRTLTPEFCHAVETPSPEPFYHQELQRRKDFSYPPVVPGIALYGSSQDLMDIRRTFPNLELLGPVRTTGKHYLLFAKRCSVDHAMIQTLPDSVWIDPNPERLPIR
ncbi:MAG: hypothetical protein HYZ08_02735 [Candidatus Kerfeldbacteria bacterium]|nr:hypothetical protein [Candidatus Kerfeldbacteria bacterium]